jgi:zinc protease
MLRTLGRKVIGTFALSLLSMPALADTVSHFTLDNGMEVVVIEDHRAPVVTQMVWYKIGRADEAPGHSGIAHFFEHLMFKGTKEVGPNEFSAIVEKQGGDDNAFTTEDYTAYFQRVAADRLDLMMKLEADRMVNLNMSEEDVTTERQVILEERGQRVDGDPGSLLQEQMQAAQFLNHPYGIPVIGWRHEIAALTRDDANAFYKAYYAPNNAILIVAGDVDPQKVLAMAKDHYGPLPPSDKIKPRIRPSEPPQLAERRLVLRDERVAQPYVARTYLAPARKSGDQKEAAALTVLAELLGGSGTTSVLTRALQFDSHVAVYSSAYYSDVSVDPDTFGFALVPADGVSLGDAEAAMDKVIDQFLKDGPKPEDFARIKTQIRASEIYARDSAGGLARTYGAALATGLTVQDVQDWPAVLQSVTPEDVMAAARKVLNRNNAVTGWLTTPEAAQ